MRSHLDVIVAVLVMVMTSPIVAAQQPLSPADLDEETILRIMKGEEPAFGTQWELATISAFAYQPTSTFASFEYCPTGKGYMCSGTAAEDTWLKMGLGAGIEIPVGAMLGAVCASVYDGDPEGRVRLALSRFEQPLDSGGTPYSEMFGDWADTGIAWDSGYTQVCLSPVHQVTTWDDVDGDGTFGRVGYAITVVLAQGTDADELRAGAVGILWWRQISPAPAVATFNDVPVGAFGFQQIEALAASGITAGCGGGNFCPDATLTRDQMAVFLAKAFGLHYPE